MTTIATTGLVKPNRSVIIDGRKFLWDGCPYVTQVDASLAAEAYKKDSFDVQMVQVEGTYLIYTRRVVKEVAVTAP